MLATVLMENKLLMVVAAVVDQAMTMPDHMAVPLLLEVILSHYISK